MERGLIGSCPRDQAATSFLVPRSGRTLFLIELCRHNHVWSNGFTRKSKALAKISPLEGFIYKKFGESKGNLQTLVLFGIGSFAQFFLTVISKLKNSLEKIALSGD